MGRPARNLSLAAALGIAIAAGTGLLYSPMLVHFFSWDSSPSIRRDQERRALWMTIPAALVSAAAGGWIGIRIAAGRRPLPGWRAAWISAGAWIAAGILFALPTRGLSLFLTPLCAVAGGLSGLAAAVIHSKGHHGKA